MLSFSDTLAVLGALGLGTLLDAAVKEPYKKRVGEWLARFASVDRDVAYSGTQALDRVFGSSILSWKAVWRYAFISLLSISVSYIFAFVSSPPETDKYIDIFADKINITNINIILICFLSCIFGDVFSYAQTRLFVRAIDNSRSMVISVGMLAADIIVSLSIFFFTFSVARLICTIIVLHISPVQTFTHTETYAPGLLAAALAEAGVEVGSEKEVMTTFAVVLANGKSTSQLANLANLQRKSVADRLQDARSLRHVKFSAQRQCSSLTRSNLMEIRDAVGRTEQLFDMAMAEQARRRPLIENVEHIRAGIGGNYYKILAKSIASPGGTKCALDITSIESSTTAAALISAAGPFNAWLSAFERTLYDAYQVVAFKLAPYVGFDPYDSVPEYFATLKLELQQTFLGAFTPDSDRAALAYYFDDPVKSPKGKVNVPFSPMVASSLATSMFIVVYLFSLCLVKVRVMVAVAVSKLLPAFDIEKAIFTSISVAFVFLFSSVSLGLWSIQVLWRAILGYW